jgi:hypothetical protein
LRLLCFARLNILSSLLQYFLEKKHNDQILTL